MASKFADETFFELIGKNTGVKKDKEDRQYYVETGTKRRLPHRISIPVTVEDSKGKLKRKLMGTFATFGGVLSWIAVNLPQTSYEEAKEAICKYYGQPLTLRAGPTPEMIKDDPNIDVEQMALDAMVPGVIHAADHVPRKRTTKKLEDGEIAAPTKRKAKKEVKAKKPKKAKKVVIAGEKGYALVGTTKNADKALVPVTDVTELLKIKSRMRKRAGGLAPIEVEHDGLTYIFQAGLENEEIASKLKVNPWAGSNNIKGEFLVEATKKFKLTFSDATAMDIAE